MKYTTQSIQAMFGISHQTVKNWCTEFASYLSVSATPPSGRQREFTIEDIRVLALVNEMRNHGALNDEIRAALHNGQRGELSNQMATALVPTTTLVTSLADAQARIELLTQQVRIAEDAKVKAEGQVELLQAQLDSAQKEIRQLIRENAKLENHS